MIDPLFWTLVFVHVTLFIGALVCLIFALRELRKAGEILHAVEADFPVQANEVAKDGRQRAVDTSVEISGEWDEREEPRS